jgi:hypothetical protein
MKVTLGDLDVVFLSYNEVYADLFFEKWKTIFPDIKRVHGIKGLNNAHLRAAEISNTDYFILIDGDAYPLVEQFKEELSFDIPDNSTVANLQSIQSVTKTITPHGALKIINKNTAPEFFNRAKDTCVTYELQDGFSIIDSKPLSIEFTNQTPELAFFAAYKDAILFLRKTKHPVSYLDKQDITRLIDKRQRLWDWLLNGCGEPNGFYSILGAHAAIYKVFTKTIPTTRESLEFFKHENIVIPTIETYEDMMNKIKDMYNELKIPMLAPTKPEMVYTDIQERIVSLSSMYAKGTL